MKIVSKSIRWLIAPLALLIVAPLAHAQTAVPVVVVSFPSYEKTMADIDFLGQLAGQPNRSQQAEAMIQVFTQGQGLKGLDKTKPWGGALMASGSDLTPVAFLPVTSAKDLVDALASVIGPAEDDAGVLKVTPQGAPPMCIRESKGWAFVTQQPDSPLPDDPLKLLSALNSDYDVAARAYLQNVPEDKKKVALDQLKNFMTMAAAMQQHGSQAPGMAELRKKSMEEQLKAIEQFVNEADQITLGWNIDPKLKTTHFDCTITAKPGTDLDSQMQLLTETHSDFAGFLMPEGAAKINRAGRLSPQQIEQSEAALEQLKQQADQSLDSDQDLSDDEKAALKEELPQSLDLVQQSLKAGKFDSGATLMLAPEKLQVAIGALVTDGPAVDALITKFVDGPGLKAVLKKIVHEAGGEEVNFDGAINNVAVDAYNGVNLHQVSIKWPEQVDEKVRKVFGEPLPLYYGTGPKSAYLAVGSGSLDLLKKAIDGSAAEPNKAVLPMQASLALEPVVAFFASLKEEDSASSGINTFAEELKKVKGKDHILLNAKPIANGTTVRLQVEDGVLEAIMQTSKLKMKSSAGKAAAPGAMRATPKRPGN